MTDILWRASEQTIADSRLKHYEEWLRGYAGHSFASYDELWEWSVTRVEDFWLSLYRYFDIVDHGEIREVMSADGMPHVRWFEGSKVNYAEHVFRNKTSERPAILFANETGSRAEVTWEQLEAKVASLSLWLSNQGVSKGDRIAAVLPNCPEATVAFLAANALGAIWSSCSPDFGESSLVDRFGQIEPKVVFVCDGYTYNGKVYDKATLPMVLEREISSIEKIVVLDYLGLEAIDQRGYSKWSDCMGEEAELRFEPVEFGHPIWILFSSGTTGIPKAITHSHGGILLEHYKYLALHNDVHPGEVFFWYSTTGWMMWNLLQSSLLVGATMLLYEGSPSHPDMKSLWRLIEECGIHHFGTGAAFLTACMKEDLVPSEDINLDILRSIGSTGSPLSKDAYDWCYSSVKRDLWLCSMSGGTDVCTAFVGSVITKPVRRGRIQTRALASAIEAYDDYGASITDAQGEMVISAAMPSMPIYFWNDPGKIRYLSSYFGVYQDVWRHGDWIEIDSRDGSLVISGRSDATLNRHGVRIGTAEIYRALYTIEAVKDALIVNIEREDGSHYMPLFVVMRGRQPLDDDMIRGIKSTLRQMYSPRHVPDEIMAVSDIPYTISGKKLETPIKKILKGMDFRTVVNPDALRNPESLQFFVDFARHM